MEVLRTARKKALVKNFYCGLDTECTGNFVWNIRL